MGEWGDKTTMRNQSASARRLGPQKPEDSQNILAFLELTTSLEASNLTENFSDFRIDKFIY